MRPVPSSTPELRNLRDSVTADESKFSILSNKEEETILTALQNFEFIFSLKNQVFREQMADDIKINRKLTQLKESRTTPRLEVSNTCNF